MNAVLIFFALAAVPFFAVSSYAANVAVIPVPERHVVTMSGAACPIGSYAVVGFFRGFSNTAAERAALAGLGVQSYIRDNFVPLGNPDAPIFAANGISPANFGAAADNTVGVKLLGAAPNQYVSASGAVSSNSLVFANGTPNALVADGVTRGTRLLILIYNTPNPDDFTELGIYSATTWLVSTSTVVTVASLPLSVIDDAGTEVFRGALGSLVLGGVIPEPGAAMMALLAGASLIMRRHR